MAQMEPVGAVQVDAADPMDVVESSATPPDQSSTTWLPAPTDIGKLCPSMTSTVAATVQYVGGCVRCALRMGGWGEDRLYGNDEDCLQQTLAQLPPHPVVHTGVSDVGTGNLSIPPIAAADGWTKGMCTLCLGLLQDTVSTPVVRAAQDYTDRQIRDAATNSTPLSGPEDAVHATLSGAPIAEALGEELRQSGYSYGHIGFTLVTPACLPIRHCAFLHAFDPHMRAQPIQTVTVKDAFRSMLITKLTNMLGIEYSNTADLAMDLVADHWEADLHGCRTINQSPTATTKPKDRGGWRRTDPSLLAKKARLTAPEPISPLPPLATLPDVLTRMPDSLREPLRQWALGGFKDGQPPGKNWGPGPKGPCNIRVGLRRDPIYIWGRYNKYSREIPQSPWVMEGRGRIGKWSVHEIAAEPFDSFTDCTGSSLHGAGREDMDVMMLGNGRPFTLEVINSKRTAEEIQARMPALLEEVNAPTGRNEGGFVKVKELKVVPKTVCTEIQAGAEGKRKLYRALVWVEKAVTPEDLKVLDTQGEFTVNQKTPVRVAHRRAHMVRPRLVHEMRVNRYIDEHNFELDLTTSAGMYIKEFVHSDLGRTLPNVSTFLGCQADILQLDVVGVEDKWTRLEDDPAAAAEHGPPPLVVQPVSPGVEAPTPE